MKTYPKRLIEVDLPIKRISEHARREKSIRHGHISTLHIWWARRPLAACRAVICAALWPDPADRLCPQKFRDDACEAINRFAEKATLDKNFAEHCSPENWNRWQALAKKGGLDPSKEAHWNILRNALLDFIADFSNWDNSTVEEYLDTSRELTQSAHEALGGIVGTRPLVVDPFAGGGSIPLEALRVGADTFASDLNPVAVLLNKVVLEYIPRYGQQLADEVRKWGERVKEQAERELGRYYPTDPDGATPIAYLWARTIKCQGPGCGATIPLFRSDCLAQRGKNSVFLNLKCDPQTKEINFEISSSRGQKRERGGILRRSSATCPICGYTTSGEDVRDQFKGRKGGCADARLLAVVTTDSTKGKRRYRLATKEDRNPLVKASKDLEQKLETSPSDIPNEELPYLRSIFNIHLLDVTKWSQLYTPRQLASLIRLIGIVRRLGVEVLGSGCPKQLAVATVTCLALAVDRVAAQFCSLSWWQPKGEFVVGAFGRQALGIIWDFAEIRPVGGASGDLDGAIDWILRVIEGFGSSLKNGGTAEIASATQLPLPDDSASAVITDPPYYDAVPYADLSDFFYVLLKRMLKNMHPALFAENLTPKEREIVQLAERNPIYSYKTKEHFERGMKEALLEGLRLTVPSGIGLFVFAHKTTQGWELMLSSLIGAGWCVTASWPIDTERAVRMRASRSAALASSVHLVCRPRHETYGSIGNVVGDWRDVLTALPMRIHEWMPRLGVEGVVGADAIFACLGPALEIFSQYDRVEKANGEQVPLKEYLEHVWSAVAKEALNMIFEGADATGFEEDARLTAMWLWTLSTGKNGNDNVSEESNDEDQEEEATTMKATLSGYMLEYDAARKIAQGLGAHLERLTSLVEVKGDKARLLPVADRARHLFGKNEGAAPTRRKAKPKQLSLLNELDELDVADSGWGEKSAPKVGNTVLDRVHQSMILFAAGRNEALKRFLVSDGAGSDQRFWRLAQALSALYPSSTDEKRWVDGVLARKKGMGF